MTAAKFSRVRKALLLGSAFGLMAGAAHAAEWKIVEMTGAVRVAAPGADATAGRQGQTLPVGTSVTTFQGGRAVLDNGLQHIVVGPNSRMTLAPEQGGMARVLQDLGAVMFQVDKKDKPHFRVETPLLTAVVKGTTFTVDVQPTSDAVAVAEGLVEVRSNMNNLGRDVPAGAAGAVMRDAPMAVQLSTLTTTSAMPAPEPTAALPPLDYRAASDGLIGGPAAPAPAAGLAINAVAGPAPSTAEAPIQTPASSASPGTMPATTLASQVTGAQLSVTAKIDGDGAVTLASAPIGILAGARAGANAGGNGNGNSNGAIGPQKAGAAEDGGPGKGPKGSGNGNGNGNGDAGLAGGLPGGPSDEPGKGKDSKGEKGGGNGNGSPGLLAGVSGALPDDSGKGKDGKEGKEDKGGGNGNGAAELVAVAGGALDGSGKDEDKNKGEKGDSGNGNGNSALLAGVPGPPEESGKGKGSGKDDAAGDSGSAGLLAGAVGGLIDTVAGATDAVGAAVSSGNSGGGNGTGNSGNGNAGGGVVNSLLAGLGKK